MRVVTFGEILLRLASPGYSRLFQKDALEATFCGGEANVAVSLSIFGMESVFVTKLPDSDIGHAAAHSLDYFKVDTSKIIFGNGRMGLYYLEKGASQRPSKIIYDREFSSIALANRDEFDWDEIFKEANWFHWTGINPALSNELATICLEACKKAKEHGLTISCDLNYRAKLWSPQKAREVMRPLMKFVDVCICNEEDAEKALGIKYDGNQIENGELSIPSYLKTAQSICETYNCQYVATTLRKSYSASRNVWSAVLYSNKEKKQYMSHEYDIQIVDRVGGGDSFSAALIYSFLNGSEPQSAVDFATAASCLKQTIEGDYNRVSVNEINYMLENGGNGRVQR